MRAALVRRSGQRERRGERALLSLGYVKFHLSLSLFSSLRSCLQEN